MNGDALEGALIPAPPTGDAVERRRVLVVDDYVDGADFLGSLLGQEGFDVLVVHDPLAALASLERFRPDAAILEIRMPVMNGYELARRLRAQLTQPCRFIALTGYWEPSNVAESKAAGFEVHLFKPVQLQELVALLR